MRQTLLLALLVATTCFSQTLSYEKLNAEGDSLLGEGQYDEALLKYRQAQSQAHRVGDIVAEATTLTNQGVAYRLTEHPDSALHCYQRALALVENTDEKAETAHVLCSIAILYINTGRRDESEDFARRAAQTAHESGDIDMIMYCDYTLGSILTLQGKFSEAINALRDMVAEADRQQRPVFMLKGYTAIIDYFMKAEMSDSIEPYIAVADTIFPRVPVAAPEVLGYLEEKYLVQRYLGQYAESLQTQHTLLRLREKGLVTPIDRLYNIMARNYADLHQYAEAAQYYEMALAAKDSIAESNISEQMSEFSARFDTQQKELEIARLSASRSRMLMGLSLAAAVILLLLLLVAMIRRNARLRSARRYIEGMEEESQRIGRELHDGIAGDLLALRMQADGMQADDMQEVLGTVYDDVRRVSHELMPPRFDKVSLRECIATYLQTVPAATLSCEGDIDIDPQKAFHLYRILQETISNIRRHASATYIKVTLTAHSLVIENNGCALTASTGRGSDTIRHRASTIGGEERMMVSGEVCTETISF